MWICFDPQITQIYADCILFKNPGANGSIEIRCGSKKDLMAEWVL